MKKEINELLKNLNIPEKDAITLFHIDATKLKTLFTAQQILNDIDTYFKDSTYFMPCLPWNSSEYSQYIKTGSSFNLKKTPSKVNLITEIFRRQKNVIRSLHPVFSICGKGSKAIDILSEHHKSIEPFGKVSPHYKIMKNGGYIVGLGVDCNTNAIIHLLDDMLYPMYNFDVYAKEIYETICIDNNQEVLVKSKVLLPSTVKQIKPRNLRSILKEKSFYKEFTINNIPFYSIKIDEYIDFLYTYSVNYIKQNGKPLHYNQEL